MVLAEYTSSFTLASSINMFFIEKIHNIKMEFLLLEACLPAYSFVDIDTIMNVCNTHTHDIHHLFDCTHIRTTLSPLDLRTDPAGVMELLARWRDKLGGGPKAG